MSFEAFFLIGYANALLLVALGLDRLGRVNPSPWTSRVLAGHRRRHPEGAADAGPGPGRRPGVRGDAGWPHSEQRRLHTGMALVATAAAIVIVAAGLVRHHAGVPGVLLVATGAASSGVLIRLRAALGHGARSVRRSALTRPRRG